jgi:hypothetical protein
VKRREFITRTMPSIIVLALLVAVFLPRSAWAQTETFRAAASPAQPAGTPTAR